jgi:hypothetical protein
MGMLRRPRQEIAAIAITSPVVFFMIESSCKRKVIKKVTGYKPSSFTFLDSRERARKIFFVKMK